MTKKVLLLQAGVAFVEQDQESAEKFVAKRGATALDISSCSLQQIVDMACDYGSSYGRIPMFGAYFPIKYKDYIIDTNDEDWWYNQVGK